MGNCGCLTGNYDYYAPPIIKDYASPDQIPQLFRDYFERMNSQSDLSARTVSKAARESYELIYGRGTVEQDFGSNSNFGVAPPTDFTGINVEYDSDWKRGNLQVITKSLNLAYGEDPRSRRLMDVRIGSIMQYFLTNTRDATLVKKDIQYKYLVPNSWNKIIITRKSTSEVYVNLLLHKEHDISMHIPRT